MIKLELVIKAVVIQETRESEKHVTNSPEWYFQKEGISRSATEERTWILERGMSNPVTLPLIGYEKTSYLTLFEP